MVFREDAVSHVTNVIAAWSCAEDEVAVTRALNAAMAEHTQGARWLRERPCCQGELLNALAVGDKRPELELHVLALNGMCDALGALVEAFLAYRWEEPTEAVLVVVPQEGDWRVFRPVADEMGARELVNALAVLLRQAEREVVPRDPRWDGWGDVVKRTLGRADEYLRGRM